MPNNSKPTSINSPTFEFKSGIVTIPVFKLYSTDINAITRQLHKKIKQASNFFTNSALLLDLQALTDQELDIGLLVNAIRNAGMLPVGIRGGSKEQQKIANNLMLPKLSIHDSNTDKSDIAEKKVTEINPKASTTKVEATIITKPIRSGQRVYAKGDLIIIAHVSAGAEIMAEGNIHVYGTLRGRALAGVPVNENARIFCADLQAELVSIAGNYRVSEDIAELEQNTCVQVYLSKQAIIIQNI